jgi:hypothetical protein
MRYFSGFPNRTLCGVLENKRAMIKRALEVKKLPNEVAEVLRTLYIAVEEAQFYADRMESALQDRKDYYEWKEKRSRLKRELKELNRKIKKRKEQLPQKDGENGEEDPEF